jgi:DNA adenine methylase
MRAHGAYLEPFAGSLAVLLSKPPVPVEIVNDTYETLITFYRVLRSQPDELIRQIMLTPYSRTEFNLARGDDPQLPEIERARQFFVHLNGSFVSSNGRGSWTSTTHSNSGHSNATKWARFQQRLYAVVERLTTVQIECGDAMDLLAKLTKSDDRAVVYCDPPYLDISRNGSQYLHDMGSVEAHKLLASELARVAGTGRQVLISGYANQYYDEWYHDWQCVEMTTTRNSRSGRGSVSQQECLWVSPNVPRKRLIGRKLSV